ncbi:MAG: LOW QUALITY PROTEIN: hypothetical protein JOS17DRAFT_777552 [Linnemannia elongata]|nr:MAG: LOW QUALITY PROTEIN: hypothetical protein JOS17DRAFT_777552 [Linnemannia elongata]
MVAASNNDIQVSQHGDASVLKASTVLLPAVKPDQNLVMVGFQLYRHQVQGLSPCESRPSSLVTSKVFGVIVEVGSETQHGFKAGDRVASLGNDTCAESVAVNTVDLTNPPDDVSLRHGLTAVGQVLKGYTVQKVDWIVIHATQLVRLLGTHVIGAASTKEKAALIKVVSAEHVVLINNSYDTLEKNVHEVTNGQGVHTMLDSVGQASFESSLNIVRRMGTLVLYGHASGVIPPFLLIRLANRKGYALTGISKAASHILPFTYTSKADTQRGIFCQLLQD